MTEGKRKGEARQAVLENSDDDVEELFVCTAGSLRMLAVRNRSVARDREC